MSLPGPCGQNPPGSCPGVVAARQHRYSRPPGCCGRKKGAADQGPEQEALGRSRGGFSTKIHVSVSGLGDFGAIHISRVQRLSGPFHSLGHSRPDGRLARDQLCREAARLSSYVLHDASPIGFNFSIVFYGTLHARSAKHVPPSINIGLNNILSSG